MPLYHAAGRRAVALHPEGVDRNNPERLVTAEKAQVALHPEGVDRNLILRLQKDAAPGRPPPGGRG